MTADVGGRHGPGRMAVPTRNTQIWRRSKGLALSPCAGPNAPLYQNDLASVLE